MAIIRPASYGLAAALVIEVVMTFGFVTVILGATDKRVTPGMAGLAIGLALTLIHLVSIPVTNTSVNPGPQHRAGAVRGRRGPVAALAVLGGAAPWRRDRGRRLRLAAQQGLTAPAGLR